MTRPCPSDFTLDRLFAGELGFEQKRELEQHMAGCDACHAFMRARREGFEAFPELRSDAVLARVQEQGSRPAPAPEAGAWRGWLMGFSTMLALAAAVLLVVPGEPSQESASGTRTKGVLNLRVYRQRGEESAEVASGARFQPGDRLRFRVSTPAEGYVSIVGVEASGNAYPAWPLGDPSADLPPLQDQLLEGAVELDESLGPETLWLVHCATDVRCTFDPNQIAPRCPADCRTTPFRLDKAR